MSNSLAAALMARADSDLDDPMINLLADAADRIEELEVDNARLRAVITKIHDEAESNAFTSDHITCHGCADAYWTAKIALQEHTDECS